MTIKQMNDNTIHQNTSKPSGHIVSSAYIKNQKDHKQIA